MRPSPVASGSACVRVPQGLHSRPGHLLVGVARRFTSRIRLTRIETGAEADATSLMEVLLLAAAEGSMLWIHAEGPDAAEAVRALQGALDGLADGREPQEP